MEDPNNPSPETQERWSKDPNNWIWGLFYYNKEDQRLLPPKRNPSMGFTVNFANPKSVLFMIGFIWFAILIVYLITRKH